MAESLGHKAAKGAVWASVDQITMVAMRFLSNLILARILLPADFGAVAMLSIFMVVANTLIDGGFANALIQKKEPTQIDYSTIFYWNLAFSTAVYAILYLFAPLIADFYELAELKNVLRLQGLVLIINSFILIPRTRLRKRLAFKHLAIVNIVSYILAASLSIALAWWGFGVYSLVWFEMGWVIFSAIMLFVVARWIPSAAFSRESFKNLFGFGGYMLAAALLQDICKNLQNLIIGKRFSDTDLGLYSQAQKLDQISSYTLPQILVQVMFPVYSSLQDDRQRLGELMMMNMRVIALWIFPVMSVLIIAAEPILWLLYGDKWIAATPYFQILCAGGFFVCLQNVTFYAVAAVGKSRALFRWSIVKWGTLLALLLVGMQFNMKILLAFMMLSNVNIFAINVYLSAKYVGARVVSQIGNLMPVVGCIALGAVAVSILWLTLTDNKMLLAVTFFVVYASSVLLFRLQALADSGVILKKLLKKS